MMAWVDAIIEPVAFLAAAYTVAFIAGAIIEPVYWRWMIRKHGPANDRATRAPSP